jgi:hypothetical protein
MVGETDRVASQVNFVQSSKISKLREDTTGEQGLDRNIDTEHER